MKINPIDSEIVVQKNKAIKFKSKPETESEVSSNNSSNKNLVMGVGIVAAAAVAAYSLVKYHNAKNELKELSTKVKDIENKNKELTSKLEEATKSKTPESAKSKAPKDSEAIKPQAAADEAAELAERKTTIQNAEEFTFTKDSNTFTVKNGKIVECKNDKGEVWTESYLNPDNDGARDYQSKVNERLNEILEGKYSDEVKITKKKAPEVKPETNPEEIKSETSDEVKTTPETKPEKKPTETSNTDNTENTDNK